jgi:hypothetical protein
MDRTCIDSAASDSMSTPRFKVDLSDGFRVNYKNLLDDWQKEHPDEVVRPVYEPTSAVPPRDVYASSSEDEGSDLGNADPFERSKQSTWDTIMNKHMTFAAAGGDDAGSEELDGESGTSQDSEGGLQTV